MAKRAKIDERTDTAFHEAAHAVIAHRLRIGFKRVTIAPGEASLGHVVLHGVPEWVRDELGSAFRQREHVERRILVDLAGWAASEKLHGKVRDWRKTGAAGDVRSAVGFADRLVGSNEEAEAFLNWMVVRARATIRNPVIWACISALASELIKHTTLSAGRVRDIIKQAQDDYIASLQRRGR
jgi:hypothetical protein